MAEEQSVVWRANVLAQQGLSREDIEKTLLSEGHAAEAAKVAAAAVTVKPSALAMKGRAGSTDKRLVGCIIALAVPLVLLVLVFIFILGVCSMKR